MNHKTVD
ncbi:hypothetical protein D030_2170A, partial [Vibrio parahaemolyticus AQ3810]